VETRTAPQWIRERKKSYARAWAEWGGCTLLWILGLAVWSVYMVIHATRGAPAYAVACFLWPATAIGMQALRPFKRAKRYENAARSMEDAIARYELSADRPESTLIDADRRAREMVRAERIRTAPQWIRDKRRRCWMGIVGWTSPVALTCLLQVAYDLSRWRWGWPWLAVAFPVAFALLLVIAMLKTGRPVTAERILSEAIERYEYESAATDGELMEADRRATDALAGR